jgi:pyruvate dehydrogenase E2 component (dihydrolipoamide acetyltransferase)
MTEQLIKVPDIGGAEGAEVVEVLVAVGDHIDLEQSVIVVESDKASMEIPANLAGIVTTLRGRSRRRDLRGRCDPRYRRCELGSG